MRRAAASGRGWLLSGSANLSGAAWGVVTGPAGSQLQIEQYELGVLLTDVRFDEYDLPYELGARAWLGSDEPGCGVYGT